MVTYLDNELQKKSIKAKKLNYDFLGKYSSKRIVSIRVHLPNKAHPIE